MTDPGDDELLAAGRAVAERVAGTTAVADVAVRRGADSLERPAYYFSFQINPGLAGERLGRLRIRLIQGLIDWLEATGDAHQAYVAILDREDWSRRQGA